MELGGGSRSCFHESDGFARYFYRISHYTRTGMSLVYVKFVERPSYDDNFARHVPGILES